MKQYEIKACDCCEKKTRLIKLQNKYNGNVLYMCKNCYEQLFEKKEKDE